MTTLHLMFYVYRDGTTIKVMPSTDLVLSRLTIRPGSVADHKPARWMLESTGLVFAGHTRTRHVVDEGVYHLRIVGIGSKISYASDQGCRVVSCEDGEPWPALPCDPPAGVYRAALVAGADWSQHATAVPTVGDAWSRTSSGRWSAAALAHALAGSA
jgi:hypothetical protein